MGLYWVVLVMDSFNLETLVLQVWKFFFYYDFYSIYFFLFAHLRCQTSWTDSLVLSFFYFLLLYLSSHPILKRFFSILSFIFFYGIFSFSLQERVNIANLMALSLGGFKMAPGNLVSGMHSMLLSDKSVLSAWGTEFCPISLRLFVQTMWFRMNTCFSPESMELW